jgi:hypothetical protein
MIDVKTVAGLHRTTVQQWHSQQIDNPYHGFLHLICDQHQTNYLLWHQEEIARNPQAGDAKIAEAKRTIDRLSQKRSALLEKVDDCLVSQLEAWGARPRPGARLNTETPGSVIDRLSILALRIYHAEEQTRRGDLDEGQAEEIAHRLTILQEQHKDLSASLVELLDDIVAGRKRLKVYRQFKTCNDPAMSPAVYAAAQRPAA